MEDDEFGDYEDWEYNHEDRYEFKPFQEEMPATITRLEVIDADGRSYTNYNCDRITLSFQDDGLTMKVFVDEIGADKAWSKLSVRNGDDY